jgi:hypothetical protein
LGVQPAEAPSPAPAATRTTKGPSKTQQAFQRGLAALAQWVEREGHRPVPRGHAEEIVVDGEPEPVVIKLGAWNSNTRARWDKLTSEQQVALAALGVPWAKAAVPAPSSPASAVTARPVPVKPLPQQDHHDECDKSVYEGSTCDLIEQYGPPSEQGDY